jgi:hypothetical protein
MTVHSPSADDSVGLVEENIDAGNEFDNGQALQEGWGRLRICRQRQRTVADSEKW